MHRIQEQKDDNRLIALLLDCSAFACTSSGAEPGFGEANIPAYRYERIALDRYDSHIKIVHPLLRL